MLSNFTHNLPGSNFFMKYMFDKCKLSYDAYDLHLAVPGNENIHFQPIINYGEVKLNQHEPWKYKGKESINQKTEWD